MLDKRKFYINGEWVNPYKENDCKVINPSNEEPFATISLGSKKDTDLAVKSAKWVNHAKIPMAFQTFYIHQPQMLFLKVLFY